MNPKSLKLSTMEKTRLYFSGEEIRYDYGNSHLPWRNREHWIRQDGMWLYQPPPTEVCHNTHIWYVCIMTLVIFNFVHGHCNYIFRALREGAAFSRPYYPQTQRRPTSSLPYPQNRRRPSFSPQYPQKRRPTSSRHYPQTRPRRPALSRPYPPIRMMRHRAPWLKACSQSGRPALSRPYPPIRMMRHRAPWLKACSQS
jgi:hypothetical protein